MTFSDEGTRRTAEEIDPTVFARRGTILTVMCLAVSNVVMSVSSLNVTLPSIQRELHTSGTDLQWVVEAYVLVFAGLLLPGGAIGDRYGRRRALVVGMSVYLGALAVGSQAGSAAHLIAARAVMGVGAALIMPATLSIIMSTRPASERPAAIAKWAGSSAIGGILGPIASGLVLERFAWGGVLVLNAVAVGVMLIAVVLLVPESNDPEQRPVAVAGSLLAIAAVVSLVYGVIEAPNVGWMSAETVVAFSFAAVAAVCFVVNQLRVPRPMLDPRLFRVGPFRRGSIAIFLLFGSTFGMIFLMTQYLQFVKGFTAMRTAFFMIPSAVVITLFARRSPQLARRYGPEPVVRAGFLCAASGYAVLALLGPHSFAGLVIVALALTGLATALTMPIATQEIVNAVPAGKEGVGSAVNDLTREVGGALGVAVISSLAATVYRASTFEEAIADPANRSAAGESIGRAITTARSLPSSMASDIVTGARDAFTDGTRACFIMLTVFALIAAGTLPRRPSARVDVAHVAPGGSSDMEDRDL